MLKIAYSGAERTNSSHQHSTKLPRIIHFKGRLISGLKSEDNKTKRAGNKTTKNVSFADLDKKKVSVEETEECPYKWIADDTLYMRQYGHHLVEEKRDDICENTCDFKPVECKGDLCSGHYHYPSYKHIPGGYRSPSDRGNSSSEQRGSDSYTFFTSSVPSDVSSVYSVSSPHSGLSWKSESYEEGRKYGDSSTKKSFLPPIDPHIISVKKKYGLLK